MSKSKEENFILRVNTDLLVIVFCLLLIGLIVHTIMGYLGYVGFSWIVRKAVITLFLSILTLHILCSDFGFLVKFFHASVNTLLSSITLYWFDNFFTVAFFLPLLLAPFLIVFYKNCIEYLWNRK